MVTTNWANNLLNILCRRVTESSGSSINYYHSYLGLGITLPSTMQDPGKNGKLFREPLYRTGDATPSPNDRGKWPSDGTDADDSQRTSYRRVLLASLDPSSPGSLTAPNDGIIVNTDRPIMFDECTDAWGTEIQSGDPGTITDTRIKYFGIFDSPSGTYSDQDVVVESSGGITSTIHCYAINTPPILWGTINDGTSIVINGTSTHCVAVFSKNAFKLSIDRTLS